MISFDNENKRWTIRNKTFTYQIGLKNNVCHHICLLPLGYAQEIDYNLIMGRETQPETEIQINNEPRCVHCGTRWIACATSRRAVYQNHVISDDGLGSNTLVITSVDQTTGLQIDNHYIVYEDSQVLTRYTVLKNTSLIPINIQHLGSFSVHGMPFFTDGIPERDIYIHSFPSSWTWEGQYKITSATDAGLFSKNNLSSWRVENTGSWSSKDYIPFFIIEQKSKNIFWAVQIEHSGSWRFELGGGGVGEGPLYMQGGLGNFMYAHWSKMLAPGEKFESIKASLSCTSGEIDDVMNIFQNHRVLRQIKKSSTDAILPIIFNEWRSTQGAVREQTINNHLAVLENSGIEIYTIDAGWYMDYGNATISGDWFSHAGDWDPHPSRFPNGFRQTADRIRKAGMIPGIWTEIEIVGIDSKAFTDKTDLFMFNETGFVESGSRRFLYFGDQKTRDYATGIYEKLIQDGFGYFKIDYNVDCGLGCLNSGDSLGQGLLDHVRGYYLWLDGLRKKHPEVIFENCSSGGNRLDYGLLSRSDLASVTDQSDWFRLGAIFYGVSSYIHPSQVGIWSVVKEELEERELVFSMINSMMGRMHISGMIEQLSESKRQIVTDAIVFYKRWREIIGDTRIYHHTPYVSLQYPEGWMVIQMCGIDSKKMLVGAWRLKSVEAEHYVSLKEIDAAKNYAISEFPQSETTTANGLAIAENFKIVLNEEFSAILYGIEIVE